MRRGTLDRVTTLILSPRYTEDSSLVRDAALAAGWRVERVQGWRVPEHSREDADIAVYGEPLFAAVVADQLGRVLLEPPFAWLTTIPARHLGRAVRFATLSEARTIEGPAFIKPADDKCFPARVYPSGDALLGGARVPLDTPVLIADPVDIELELRCFVLDRRVETLSIYARDGALARDGDGSWPATTRELEEAGAFAERVLEDPVVTLPAAVVVDVGRLREGGEWVVIEANPAWGSGIYGCDPHRVLRVVHRACLRRDQLSADDRRWIVERAA